MDVEFTLKGITFIANDQKMESNLTKHGVSFQLAAEAFFDPFFVFKDASRNYEDRDAIIGYDDSGKKLFYVVYVELDDKIRLISARKTTKEERLEYENQ